MIARSMIAGAAVIALATGCHPRPVSRASLGELPDPNGPVKLTQKQYTDQEGNTLSLEFGAERGKVVKAEAKDRHGNKIDVVEIPLKDMTVCVPKAPQPLCQPLAFVSDGAFIKMGTATCTCYVIGGTPYCYGNTCR